MNKQNKVHGSGFRVQWFKPLAVLVAAALVTAAAPAAEKQARELTLAECVGLALENNLDLKIEKTFAHGGEAGGGGRQRRLRSGTVDFRDPPARGNGGGKRRDVGRSAGGPGRGDG